MALTEHSLRVVTKEINAVPESLDLIGEFTALCHSLSETDFIILNRRLNESS
jgi:hypothetical protein